MSSFDIYRLVHPCSGGTPAKMLVGRLVDTDYGSALRESLRQADGPFLVERTNVNEESTRVE